MTTSSKENTQYEITITIGVENCMNIRAKVFCYLFLLRFAVLIVIIISTLVICKRINYIENLIIVTL